MSLLKVIHFEMGGGIGVGVEVEIGVDVEVLVGEMCGLDVGTGVMR